MEPPESITDSLELDRKFTEACNTAFKFACSTGKPRGTKKLLVDPTIINPQNQLQRPV